MAGVDDLRLADRRQHALGGARVKRRIVGAGTQVVLKRVLHLAAILVEPRVESENSVIRPQHRAIRSHCSPQSTTVPDPWGRRIRSCTTLAPRKKSRAARKMHKIYARKSPPPPSPRIGAATSRQLQAPSADASHMPKLCGNTRVDQSRSGPYRALFGTSEAPAGNPPHIGTDSNNILWCPVICSAAYMNPHRSPNRFYQSDGRRGPARRQLFVTYPFKRRFAALKAIPTNGRTREAVPASAPRSRRWRHARDARVFRPTCQFASSAAARSLARQP